MLNTFLTAENVIISDQRLVAFFHLCVSLIVRCISQMVMFLITLGPLLSGKRSLRDKSALRATKLWWERQEPPKHLVTSGFEETNL